MEATHHVPTVGASVCSSDGQEFGRVKEVRGGYFEVDTARMDDFWLSCKYVGRTEGEAVHLSLTLDDVNSHSLRAPGLETTQEEGAPRLTDSVLSDEEALSQRERMERQLAAQRGGQLDSGLRHPSNQANQAN